MNFSEQDKKHLLRCYGGDKNALNEDLPQIEQAADTTTYELVTCEKDNYSGKTTAERISRKKAIELLGRAAWLSGLARSAFHFTAVRTLGDGRRYVSFDSSVLFRE